MKEETFKEKISNGLQFYFRPKLDSQSVLYYQVDGYQNKIKFKLVRTSATDRIGNLEFAEWKISDDSNVPKEVKELELDFNDIISS